MMWRLVLVVVLVDLILPMRMIGADEDGDALEGLLSDMGGDDGVEMAVEKRQRTRRKTSCPRDFTLLQSYGGLNGCFKIGLEARTWQEWGQLCRSYNPSARLAVLQDKGKSDAVRHYLQTIPDSDLRECGKQSYKMPNGFYTAGQRQVNNNCQSKFYWKPIGERESPVTFYDWAADEPNCYGEKGYTRESCIVLWEHDGYRWNDLACERKMCAICEIP